MNSNSSGTGTMFVGALLLAALAFTSLRPMSAPIYVPVDEDLPATTLDLSDAFAANRNVAERRQHAGDLRRIFDITADGIEYDARQLLSERVFSDGAQLDHHIVTVRKFFSQEWRFRDHYPSLGEAIEKFLRERLGSYLQGNLTDAARREWVGVLREVQAAAAAVEGGSS